MKQPIVDLRRESECNGVENYVAIEAMEVGRQRAEAAQWTFQRIKNSLDNQQTSLSGNSVFKHTSLLCEPLLIQRSWLSVLFTVYYSFVLQLSNLALYQITIVLNNFKSNSNSTHDCD